MKRFLNFIGVGGPVIIFLLFWLGEITTLEALMAFSALINVFLVISSCCAMRLWNERGE